jgi:hypothetical protein
VVIAEAVAVAVDAAVAVIVATAVIAGKAIPAIQVGPKKHGCVCAISEHARLALSARP